MAAWAPGRRMFNAYGPTEATIWVTWSALAAGQPVGIGAPIAGVSALVLDCAAATRLRSGWWASCIWAGPGWRAATSVDQS